jgi:hypothetical protein
MANWSDEIAIYVIENQANEQFIYIHKNVIKIIEMS